jgi:hypothetical protein
MKNNYGSSSAKNVLLHKIPGNTVSSLPLLSLVAGQVLKAAQAISTTSEHLGKNQRSIGPDCGAVRKVLPSYRECDS